MSFWGAKATKDLRCNTGGFTKAEDSTARILRRCTPQDDRESDTEVTYFYDDADTYTVKVKYLDKDTGLDLAQQITKVLEIHILL